MKENYILVHGSFGNPFVNWFQYLRKEIESRGLEVYTPDFPTGVGFQNYENWSKLLQVYVDVGIINENTTIFAHSIAPIFICKFLIENKVKVKRLVFVQGFNHGIVNKEYDEVNSTFFIDDDISKVKDYCNEIICFYTDNETYVKNKEEVYNFADANSTKKVLINGGGHLNSESGYTEFKELLEYL